jgi:hypothetical protein
MVNTASKYLKNCPYSPFSLLKLNGFWPQEVAGKFRIFNIFAVTRLKNTEIGQLARRLRDENIFNLNDLKCEYGHFFKYFEAVFAIFQYHINSQTQLLRKRRIILLWDIQLGMA